MSHLNASLRGASPLIPCRIQAPCLLVHLFMILISNAPSSFLLLGRAPLQNKVKFSLRPRPVVHSASSFAAPPQSSPCASGLPQPAVLDSAPVRLQDVSVSTAEVPRALCWGRPAGPRPPALPHHSALRPNPLAMVAGEFKPHSRRHRRLNITPSEVDAVGRRPSSPDAAAGTKLVLAAEN